MSSNTTDTSLITFKAITNFITELHDFFGESHRVIKLYCHLINKTTLAHTTAINKHIKAFKDFCTENREAIYNKDDTLFTENNSIIYSQRVYINISELLCECNKDTSQCIWAHLLAISACVDPSGGAKRILQEQIGNNNKGLEVDFLSKIIDKVEKEVDPDADPMQAVSSIMQSGVFTDLVQGMGAGLQDGSLDLGKLMGTVQGMVSKINGEGSENDPAMSMMNNMMNNLGNVKNENSSDESAHPSVPDLAGMMGPLLNSLNQDGESGGQVPDIASMMGPMLSSLTQNQDGESGGQVPDIASMMGPMLSSLTQNQDGESGGQVPDIASMMGPMLSSLTQNQDGESGGQVPDIASMMGPMMQAMSQGGGQSDGGGMQNMMSAMLSGGMQNMIQNNNEEQSGPQLNSVEKQINSQLEQAKKDGKL